MSWVFLKVWHPYQLLLLPWAQPEVLLMSLPSSVPFWPLSSRPGPTVSLGSVADPVWFQFSLSISSFDRRPQSLPSFLGTFPACFHHLRGGVADLGSTVPSGGQGAAVRCRLYLEVFRLKGLLVLLNITRVCFLLHQALLQWLLFCSHDLSTVHWAVSLKLPQLHITFC